MNENNVQVHLDYKTPNLINYIFTSIIILILVLINISQGKYALCLAMVLTFLLSTVVFFVKQIPQFIKSTLLPLFPPIAMTIVVLEEKQLTTFFTIMIICMIMGALYYNKKLLLVHTVLINIMTFTLIIILKNGILSTDLPASEGFQHMIRMNMAALFLYILTKRGYQYIYNATHAKQEAVDLVDKLNVVMNSSKQAIDLLDQGILATGNSVSELETSSINIMNATNQMAEGISQQSQLTSEVSQLAVSSLDNMEKTKELSIGVEQISKQMSEKIDSNLNQVNVMNSEMLSIKQSIDTTYTAVHELQDNIENINILLNDISGIAHQTNLLALNASIEAARAGEQGKGFAIVAEEVRKLSEKAQITAKNVFTIVDQIKNSTHFTMEKVTAGTTSVDNGSNIMYQLYNSFNDIQNGFQSLHHEISQEQDYIEDISDNYNKIMNSIKHIAEISIDHSATAEEISASIEEQNSQLQYITVQMNSLKKESNTLREKVNVKN